MFSFLFSCDKNHTTCHIMSSDYNFSPAKWECDSLPTHVSQTLEYVGCRESFSANQTLAERGQPKKVQLKERWQMFQFGCHLFFCFCCCCFAPETLPYCCGSIRRQAVCHRSLSLNPPCSLFRFRFTSLSRVEFLSNIHFTFDTICCKHGVERQGCGKLCVAILVYIR